MTASFSPLVGDGRLAAPGVVSIDAEDGNGRLRPAGLAVAAFVLSRWSRTKPGAGGGIRTLMTLRSADFESAASAIPLRRGVIVAPPGRQGQDHNPLDPTSDDRKENFLKFNCEAIDGRGFVKYITASDR